MTDSRERRTGASTTPLVTSFQAATVVAVETDGIVVVALIAAPKDGRRHYLLIHRRLFPDHLRSSMPRPYPRLELCREEAYWEQGGEQLSLQRNHLRVDFGEGRRVLAMQSAAVEVDLSHIGEEDYLAMHRCLARVYGLSIVTTGFDGDGHPWLVGGVLDVAETRSRRA